MKSSTVDRVAYKEMMKTIAYRAAFYRANPQRFCKDYLGIHLKIFQQILLVAMFDNAHFMYIASRGQGKTFLTAVFSVTRAILYPNTTIVVASRTREQAGIVVQKIKALSNESKNLELEIEYIVNTTNRCEVVFKNGSIIKVVTATDSSRGNRANVLIIDEFRMVSIEIINKVLKKFISAPRDVGYMHKKEYAHLKERNKEIYLSSAWYQSHWSYEKVKAYFNNVIDGRKYFICGLPYQMAVKENLLSRQDIEDEMSESDFSEVSFAMEMECNWYSDTEGSLYSYEDIAPNRVIKYPMLSNKLVAGLSKDLLAIKPKANGELRLLSVDVALMSSTKTKNNDATSIFINQLTPVKGSRYVSNIIYTENIEGIRTDRLSLIIRKLYEEYMCDYIVLDVKNVGLSIYDDLSDDMYDTETGVVYPALSCINSSEHAARCTRPNAPKVIWVIAGTAKFNNDCALILREGFRQGQIKLLLSEFEIEEQLSEIKGYDDLSINEKEAIRMPYIHTSLLIQELIKLQYEVKDNVIKVKERSGERKDRYSSISYNFWVAKQLEQKLKKKNNVNTSTDKIEFLFKAPKVKARR